MHVCYICAERRRKFRGTLVMRRRRVGNFHLYTHLTSLVSSSSDYPKTYSLGANSREELPRRNETFSRALSAATFRKKNRYTRAILVTCRRCTCLSSLPPARPKVCSRLLLRCKTEPKGNFRPGCWTFSRAPISSLCAKFSLSSPSFWGRP